MDTVMTQGPTLCNVERLSHAELKAELQRMQTQSLVMGNKLHDMNLVAYRQAALLHSLVDAHERGDKTAIETKLQELTDWRKAQMKPATQH